MEECQQRRLPYFLGSNFTETFIRLLSPEHGHLNDIADFASSECVGKVVKVLDWLVAKLHENVSDLQAGFGC